MFKFRKKSQYCGSSEEKDLKDEKRPEIKRIIFFSVVLVVIFISVIMCIVTVLSRKTNNVTISTSEIARSMTYDKVNKGEESVQGTDNVKFDAFFLRDLDGDGYAEGIRGTCKELGKEDTLYMELNVQTAGVLKDAKITVNGQNFYLQTALPKDEQLKNNYISNNTKEIEFNQISNGTQKLIVGVVRSGDYTYSSKDTQAIGNDINKYSVEDNTVTLTGTYVTDAGEEIAINKTVTFTVDWYGKTNASIGSVYQTEYLTNAINEEKQTFTMNFNVSTEENLKQLLLSKLVVSGTIPELNGYKPIEVRLLNNTDKFEYDEETKKFTIEKQAITDENGIVTSSIARNNTYQIQAVYPLEAYEKIGTEEIRLTIPVQAYYEGYNNKNGEFTNPYKSNIAKASIVKYFRNPTEKQAKAYVTVGKYAYSPYYRYMIQKSKPLNLYNGKSEKETDDTYTVTWGVYAGTTETTDPLVLKENAPDSFIKTDGSEESMDGITNYRGIYFGNFENMLGENGYIKVYDDETNILLETFDKTNVKKYSSSNPYKYENLVKRIRIETSETTKDTSLYIYHVKELDDNAIIEKYEKEEFNNLQYIKSELNVQRGKTQIKASNKANYEASMSLANIQISKDTFSTQDEEKNVTLTIHTECDESSNLEKWINGTFLVKLPEEILEVEINEVKIDNSGVKITNYEIIEQDESKFIKITTENEKEASYNIKIDLNIMPDPRKASATTNIELYASNENANEYYEKGQDIYDLNNNLNTTENVNQTTKAVTFIAPSSLITNQIASEYDEEGNTVISSQIAEIKPQVASVDQELEEKTAKIGIIIRNNYSNTISDVMILGKIPFEGNTYTLTGKELNSQFTTKMTSSGIQLPEQVANIAKVYYSEMENPSKDLTDESNCWKTAEQVENWDNIKTYIIDLNSYVIPIGEELIFNYKIKVPNGLEYNKISYSHHGVYFSLDTAEGKYQTQTQTNKIGFKIAEKYDLQLTKYQVSKDKVVPGAIYKITEEGQTEGNTAITDENGILKFKNLYVEKTYLVEEIKAPSDYELNTDIIKFVGHVDKNGLKIEKIQGNLKDDSINVEKNENENYKAIINVEDEVKAKLKIIKKEKGTETTIKGARFKILGDGLPASGKIVTTDSNGEISTNGLKIGSTYDLIEVSVNGYYLADQVKFIINNNDGNYELRILRGTTRENSIVYENDIPIINLTIDDSKIPTYDLEIIKIKKTINVNVSDNENDKGDSTENITYLQGAKFSLYKDKKEIGRYETGEDGKVVITDLYRYIDRKDEKATYTLKETSAPDGYAKVKDITFKVQAEDGTLKFINIDGEEAQFTANENTVSLIIADSPSFKLIKKDGETGELLSNIKFAIYNTDKGQKPATNGKGEIIGTKENINGKDYYVLTTDANGEITADLPDGYYKAVELQAPDKYDISDSVYYFGIGCASEESKSFKAEWAKTIGGDSDDQITSIVQTTDGGYIVGGYFYSSTIDLGNEVTLSNNSGEDGMLIKYSAEGEAEWAVAIGGDGDDYINSIAQTTDGGYIVGGYFNSGTIDLGNGVTLSNNSSYDGMLIKYSAEGETEWAKAIGGNSDDRINSIAQTTDGGYIVGGYFNSSTIDLGNEVTLSKNNNYDGMLIKYSAEGETEWAKAIGGSASDYINSIAQTADGGYIVGGYFYSSTIDLGNGVTLSNNYAGYYAAMLIKYNSEGEAEWAKAIEGSSAYNSITKLTQTKDEGYIIVGKFSSSIYTGNIIKLNTSGEFEWGDKIGSISDVIETEDGGCVIVGNSFGNIQLENGETLFGSAGMIKYSKNGEKEIVSIFKVDNINSIAQTTDGGYIIGGNFYSSTIDLGNEVTLSNNNSQNSKGMLIKISKEESINANIKILDEKTIGGDNGDYINSIAQTADGGYIVGGYFYSSTIDLGNGVTLSNNGNYDDDGMLIKYGAEGETEWAVAIGGDGSDNINSIAQTTDGGYIVGGNFRSKAIDLGNGVTLSNRKGKNNLDYYDDGMLIKYGAEGEIEWAVVIGGEDIDHINSIAQTTDGGYIVGGYFNSSTIDLGNGITLSNNSNYDYDGMLIKYGAEGETEWAVAIGGDGIDNINSIAQTTDGGYIVGGDFNSSTIDLGNGVTLSNNNNKNDGMLIKYGTEGEAEWAVAIGGAGDYINSIAQTTDGGYIVGESIYDSFEGKWGAAIIKYNENGNLEWEKQIGTEITNKNFSVKQTTDGGYIVNGKSNVRVVNSDENSECGIVVKYDQKGNLECARAVQNSDIYTVIEQEDGSYLVGGSFEETIQFDDETITSKGNKDGMILKMRVQMGSPEVQELVVENNRKKFKITTEVQEIDGVKGGVISGQESSIYEIVKYGDSNKKEIIMTPNENYEIIKITVNGKEQEFTANEDGTYILPTINNIIEDKHIVVTYALKDNKITINKIDSETKQALTGAKFKLDQIEERTNPEGVIKDIVDNGKDYNTDMTNEMSGALSDWIDNGTSYSSGKYYFVNKNGVYVPTNSATYQKANGGTSGKSNTTANSYIKIDLTKYTGTYYVVVNASVSSERYDYGYATITQNTTAPGYSSSTGQFMKISGKVSSKNYTSKELEGGQIYYLHFGYRKDSSVDSYEDQVKINSIKLYGGKNYNFKENNGKYESNNVGVNSTVANSYIPIDLTNCTGKYNLTVNAKISSDYSDYGYATLTEDTTRPEYYNTAGRFIYIYGNVESKDYTTVLQGGKMYYLHLGYYKNASGSSGTDKFTINSVKVTLNDSGLYHTEIETNIQGQAIAQIPFGKYVVTETQAPEGYELNQTLIELEFRADGNHEFTIENTKLAKIIVHYVFKGTDTKLAEDEVYTGKTDESYTTAPKLDLQGYTLEKDSEGNYIIPENATGTYKSEEQEITYYYVPRKARIVVHHYIEGTEISVPLSDGTIAEDIILEGEKGESYTTQAINVNNLGDNYTLTTIQANTTGIYDSQETIVTYYYAQKTGRVITHHYINGTTNSISKDVEQTLAVGKTYETKEADKIPEHYELVEIPENETGEITEEDTIVTYYYQPKKYEYKVEYYFEGEKDETLTDVYTAEYGSTVNTYKDKVKQKYHFDKFENLPLIITDDIESNIIKIYYKKNVYDITTEVEGEGGSISGQGEQPYESVYSKTDSSKDIVIIPDKGYVVKDITINGEKIQYSEDEDGTVKIAKFKTVMEDKNVVATFRKIFSIVKQGEEEKTLLPGAKFTIKDENGNDVVDKNGKQVGQIEEINGQEMSVITTDEDGRIDLDLLPGKYTIVEVQAPENYILPEDEADRTYSIEVDKGIEEIRKLKKNWTNSIGLSDIKNIQGTQIQISQDKGLLLSGGIYETETINAENMADNEDITITAVGIEDGIILHMNENSKIKWIKQIKSANAESANVILDTIQTGTNQYTAYGIFMGTVTIPAEETTSGQELSITSNSNSSSYIIRYNSEGKIELLTMLEDECDSQWAYMLNGNSNEIVLVANFEYFDVPSERTVTGEAISIETQDSQNGGTIVVKLDAQGKVKSAKEQLYGNDIDGFNYCSLKYMNDGSYIRTGSILNSITIPAEDTTDGNAINIDISTEDDNGLGIYGAVLVKYNIDGKIEYLKRIESTDTNIKMLSLGDIQTINDGYLGIAEYYNIESKKTQNTLVKFNENLEIADMIDIDETKSTDDVLIQQMEDGSYLIYNKGMMELSNYENVIVQEAVPAKEAPTLTVTNELKEYEYRVEYYYDGKIDETQTKTSKAKYGKTIEEYEDKVKDGYVLAKTENFQLTITNDLEKNVIKIYYEPKAEATVQYIDKTTGKIIEENLEDGYVGKEFKTIAKDFEGYALVEEPEQKTVEMKEEKVVLKYYYMKISSGVIEKHIDINSEELLANETYEGLVGDEYKTKEKEIEGYDLVKEKYPENTNGIMAEDAITVTYYYIKNVTLTVQYIEIDTEEKLTEDEIIKGHEKDEYTTEKKTIEGYEFVKVIGDESGNMVQDEKIIYYYKKIAVPESEKTDTQEPGEIKDNKNSESLKYNDPTVANRKIPNAGLSKTAFGLSIITFILLIFTYISYSKYKALEKEYKSKYKK